MDKFDNKIIRAIKKWSYPVWFIIKDNSIDCPCVDFTTRQADRNCRKCFGLGKKVRLRQVNAAHQNSRVSLRGDGLGAGETNVIAVYYTLKDTQATEGDMVLDGNELDVIQHAYAMRSDHSGPVYYKYETAPKKTYSSLARESLKSVIKGAGYPV